MTWKVKRYGDTYRRKRHFSVVNSLSDRARCPNVGSSCPWKAGLRYSLLPGSSPSEWHMHMGSWGRGPAWPLACWETCPSEHFVLQCQSLTCRPRVMTMAWLHSRLLWGQMRQSNGILQSRGSEWSHCHQFCQKKTNKQSNKHDSSVDGFAQDIRRWVSRPFKYN